MNVSDPTVDQIVDTALTLAEASSWEALRLHAVADALGTDLGTVSTHVREKNDLIDLWLARADTAMLHAAREDDFIALSTRERLQRLITTWLCTLAPHRRITRQMIYGRLEPGHLHIQIPALMRISRTVQWMREAAHCDRTYFFRAMEESALTAIYVTTFSYWLRDDSAEAVRTQRLLDRLLGTADSIASAVYRPARARPAQPASAASRPGPARETSV